jgi:hypothetical protein
VKTYHNDPRDLPYTELVKIVREIRPVLWPRHALTRDWSSDELDYIGSIICDHALGPTDEALTREENRNK